MSPNQEWPPPNLNKVAADGSPEESECLFLSLESLPGRKLVQDLLCEVALGMLFIPGAPIVGGYGLFRRHVPSDRTAVADL
jgi:hypothetical protein